MMFTHEPKSCRLRLRIAASLIVMGLAALAVRAQTNAPVAAPLDQPAAAANPAPSGEIPAVAPVDQPAADTHVPPGSGLPAMAPGVPTAAAATRVNSTNATSAPTGLPSPAPAPASTRSDRGFRRSSSATNRTSFGPALNTGQSGRDLSSFKIVTDRNIFDPTRRARPPRGVVVEQPKAVRVESFALVGTMIYAKGDFAFFDGTSSAYHKVVKPAESIAGFKVKDITRDRVTLEAGGRELALTVGKQLRRQDEGEWQMSDRADAYNSGSYGGSATSGSTTTTSSTSSTSGGASENDLLKRLMQQRARELKK